MDAPLLIVGEPATSPARSLDACASCGRLHRFALISVKLAEWRAGVDVENVRPVDKIGQISPRPIFIIDGLADKAVLPINSARNFAAAKEPKQIWWVQGAGHAQSRVVAGSLYVRPVVAFFRRYLGA